MEQRRYSQASSRSASQDMTWIWWGPKAHCGARMNRPLGTITSWISLFIFHALKLGTILKLCHLRLGYQTQFFVLGFRLNFCTHISSLLTPCCIPRPHFQCDYAENIWWRIQIMKLLHVWTSELHHLTSITGQWRDKYASNSVIFPSYGKNVAPNTLALMHSNSHTDNTFWGSS
jgi:hypothetical protein